MKALFSRMRNAVREDPATIWFDVVSREGIEFAEDFFGFTLPKLLKRSYREISNGGFGPGPIIGLPGGHKSSWGDLFQTWTVMQEIDECEESWLPIIDWGCWEVSLIDCDNEFQMITHYDEDFHSEEYTFDTLIDRWLAGEEPEFHTGGFRRRRKT